MGNIDATWTAMVLISLLTFLNIFTILFLLVDMSWTKESPKIIGAISIGFVGFINYIIFIKKDRCFKIIDNYKKETRKQKNLSSILVFLYVILTLFFAHYKW
jgi:hypothetical protein